MFTKSLLLNSLHIDALCYIFNIPVIVLLSLSSSSNHGLGSLLSAAQSGSSYLEPIFLYNLWSWLFFFQEDEALKPETFRMLLHSVQRPQDVVMKIVHYVTKSVFIQR